MKSDIDFVFHGCENIFHYIDYGILSVQKNAKWIRKIHVIYNDLEVSSKNSLSELKKKHPTVNYISISSFLPKEYKSSCGNNCVVESWIWKCKEISDNFIYGCNDMFIGRPVKPEDFFINKRPVVGMYSYKTDHDINKDTHIPYVKMMQSAIKKHDIHFTNFVHCVIPYNKTLLKKYYNMYKEEVDKASKNNRDNCKAGENEFNLLRLAPGLMVKHGDAYMLVSDDSRNIFSEFDQPEIWKEIRRVKPKCFCINNLHNRVPKVDKFLNSYFRSA
jgi:hypothetical protein